MDKNRLFTKPIFHPNFMHLHNNSKAPTQGIISIKLILYQAYFIPFHYSSIPITKYHNMPSNFILKFTYTIPLTNTPKYTFFSLNHPFNTHEIYYHQLSQPTQYTQNINIYTWFKHTKYTKIKPSLMAVYTNQNINIYNANLFGQHHYQNMNNMAQSPYTCHMTQNIVSKVPKCQWIVWCSLQRAPSPS